ncbi:MAG: LuxR C-terminal-related transcriptional regulator [Moritella sp.]|uniref:response regulator transcription factor n=1 Tax=Moritella sp. TaxID=78556 RepID=UPI0029BEC9B0|nr:LuxR C-terminal-related transcriptional regulator [Moritella sp.]MDX2321547.1 LuxR C-terminal-related transcriptional regulator [Moritella sp.]
MPEFTKNDFEQLIMAQSSALISSSPTDFIKLWRQIAMDALDWFNIDRLTLFPNSMILLNDGKTVSVAKAGIPPLIKQHFIGGNDKDYFKLLKIKHDWNSFTAQELQKDKCTVLNKLYEQGGRWHCIIPLQLFGQNWGALSFTRFGDNDQPLGNHDLKRLKLLCEMWLCYWQHSTLARNLQQEINENEKLLLLSKKQCAVLTLLAQGYSAKQCADKLFLSSRTIESHKYRMLDILEFDKHTELIQFALRNGLGIASD